jgi:hypothetical protein
MGQEKGMAGRRLNTQWMRSCVALWVIDTWDSGRE